MLKESLCESLHDVFEIQEFARMVIVVGTNSNPVLRLSTMYFITCIVSEHYLGPWGFGCCCNSTVKYLVKFDIFSLINILGINWCMS